MHSDLCLLNYPPIGVMMKMQSGSSSPLIPSHPTSDSIPFLSLNSDNVLSDDIYDHTFSPNQENPTYSKLSNNEKVVEILQFMKNQFPRFSMWDLLSSIFSSDLGSIKNYTNKYLKQGGRMDLLDLLVGKNLLHNEALSVWIMEKAAQICQREFSQLTDHALRGAYYVEYQHLLCTRNLAASSFQNR